MGLGSHLLQHIGGGECPETAADIPRQAELHPAQQARPVRIPRTCWVHHAAQGGDGDVILLVFDGQQRTLFALRHQHRISAFLDFRLAQTRFLLNHTQFIFVDGEHVAPIHPFQQIFAREPDGLLAGVVNVFEANLLRFAHIFFHGAGVVGGDDGQFGMGSVFGKAQFGGVGHRPRVKTGDLVLSLVGVDEEGGAKIAGDFEGGGGVYAVGFQPCAVGAEVVPGRGHHQGTAAQQPQVIGDVGGSSAPLLVHGFDQEAQADVVQLVGQDMVGKFAGEGHEVIVGDGACDNNFHNGKGEGREDWGLGSYSLRLMAYSSDNRGEL